jgi:hypothetical protein
MATSSSGPYNRRASVEGPTPESQDLIFMGNNKATETDLLWAIRTAYPNALAKHDDGPTTLAQQRIARDDKTWPILSGERSKASLKA